MAFDQFYANEIRAHEALKQAVINMREALHDHLVDEHPPCLVCGTFYKQLMALVSDEKQSGVR